MEIANGGWVDPRYSLTAHQHGIADRLAFQLPNDHTDGKFLYQCSGSPVTDPNKHRIFQAIKDQTYSHERGVFDPNWHMVHHDFGPQLAVWKAPMGEPSRVAEKMKVGTYHFFELWDLGPKGCDRHYGYTPVSKLAHMPIAKPRAHGRAFIWMLHRTTPMS